MDYLVVEAESKLESTSSYLVVSSGCGDTPPETRCLDQQASKQTNKQTQMPADETIKSRKGVASAGTMSNATAAPAASSAASVAS